MGAPGLDPTTMRATASCWAPVGSSGSGSPARRPGARACGALRDAFAHAAPPGRARAGRRPVVVGESQSAGRRAQVGSGHHVAGRGDVDARRRLDAHSTTIPRSRRPRAPRTPPLARRLRHLVRERPRSAAGRDERVDLGEWHPASVSVPPETGSRRQTGVRFPLHDLLDDPPRRRDEALRRHRRRRCHLVLRRPRRGHRAARASGCGKTTLLRLVAGFERPDAGVEIVGTVSRGASWVPPEQRRVGMVFQDYALFPHLTVAEDVGFGLPRRRRAARAGAPLDRRPRRPRASLPAPALGRPAAARLALARALAPSPSSSSSTVSKTSTPSFASLSGPRWWRSSARSASRSSS